MHPTHVHPLCSRRPSLCAGDGGVLVDVAVGLGDEGHRELSRASGEGGHVSPHWAAGGRHSRSPRDSGTGAPASNDRLSFTLDDESDFRER